MATLKCLPGGDISIPLPEGSIAVTIRNGLSQPILAIHGISSNSRLWLWLMQSDPQLTLIMPDLRGRGESLLSGGSPPEGSSVEQHARDMSHVLDHLAINTVDVLGMSMGGFVAVALAAAHPQRVKSLTLLDGGPPMRPPPSMGSPSTAMSDRFQRLDRSWSLDEYKSLFTSATAPLVDPHSSLLDDYLRYDLGIKQNETGKVRLSREWLEADAADIFSQQSLARWNRDNVKKTPTRMSRAEWSVGKDTPPAYGAEERERVTGRLLTDKVVWGQDHAGTIMTVEGAAVARSLLSEALCLDLP